MSLIKRLVCLNFLFFLVSCYALKAQFYSAGQDPSSAKWNQINTNNFQIIFQKEASNQAQQVANYLEYYYQKVGNSLEHKAKKISVIIHNQTISSNGFVSWAPKRMELYATPPQDISPDSWLEYLCIHELRHVVQFDKLNQGITEILSIVFGQQATGLIAGQLPLWYYEGDAVCTETAMSKFGRGRLPFFERGIKTHLLSDEKRYSFDKMVFGSYHDYVPGRYEFGYQLSAYVRDKYDPLTWSQVENFVAKNSYALLPTNFAFYRGLKKSIGLSQKELFKKTFNYLDSSWTIDNQKKESMSPKYFQAYEIKRYEDYLNPTLIDDDKILTLKKGLTHIPQFVIVCKDSEKLIYEPGQLASNDFSYAKNLIVWAEYRPDRRWDNREYTSVKLFNLKTHKKKVIVKKSRYFSPDLSSSAQKIVVVKIDEMNNSSLVILDSNDGSVIDEIQSNKNHFIQRPNWSDDEKYIYTIELSDAGKQVCRYSLDTKKWELLFIWGKGDIQRIRPSENYVYFHSTFNGTDNLYAFDERTQETYQISESEFGISEFDLSKNKNELITNEYTSNGFRLAKIPIERALWKKVEEEESYKFKFAEILTKQESAFNITQENNKQTEFPVKKYRKPLNIFNFHSWIPFYFDYDNMNLGNVFSDPSEIYGNIYPGIMLLSQNKLSTTESILSYGYKNGNHYLSSSLVFKGQYPVIRLSANYGNEQLIQATSDASWYPQTNNGYSYDMDIFIPFNLTKGKYIKGFRPFISVEYYDNLYYNYQDIYYIKGMEFVQTELLFYSYQRKAEADIIPELGAVLDFNLFNTPFETEFFGYMCNVDAIFYLPGWGNTGMKINLGYQYQKPELYLLQSNFNFPRGIEKKRTEKMAKLYVDYVFPIAYPDWNLGSFIYIKRFRGDLFVDYAYNTYKTANDSQNAYIWPVEHNFSFGLELNADYHLLRTIFPLNTGIRVGYTPTEGRMVFEMLFGIDLNSI